MKKIFALVASLLVASSAFAWTKSGTTYTTDGSQPDVLSAIADSSPGDTFNVPAGSFTWGAAQSQVTLNKLNLHLVFLPGANILLSPTGPYYGSGVINITANGVTVEGGTLVGAINTLGGGPSTTPISIASCNGWRITGTTYAGPFAAGYFAYIAAANGLFDTCVINGNSGMLQTFMIRGANSVWAAPHTMGTANAVYVEDCTIGGTGYANENDGAAQSCIRFNLITSQAYLDAHMIETATSASGTYHGSRQIEAYDNIYTYIAQSYNLCTAYGGTGMIFDNTVPDNGDQSVFAQVGEYGAEHGSGGDGLAFIPTPAHSPIPDQIGTGAYPQSAGQETFCFFNNKHAGGTPLGINGTSVAQASKDAFGGPFEMTSATGSPYMLLEGRDYSQNSGTGAFSSTNNIKSGLKADMLLSSPTATGQFWWVTDEGSWNKKFPPNTVGHQGQLYRWNGTSWVLYYTPYTYPHPLRGRVGGSYIYRAKLLRGSIK